MKALFTEAGNKKITEKILGRVLLSSIGSILICMACLVGTTWAWFAVSIENTENVIQIGRPEVFVSVDGSQPVSGTELQAGEHTVTLKHSSEVDSLQQKSTLYVILTLDGTNSQYVMLGGQNSDIVEIPLELGKNCTFAWSVTWFEPAGAEPLTETAIRVEADLPQEPSEGTNQPGEDAAEPSEGASEPSEDTAKPSEDAKEPSTETTESQPTDVISNLNEDEFPLTVLGYQAFLQKTKDRDASHMEASLVCYIG